MSRTGRNAVGALVVGLTLVGAAPASAERRGTGGRRRYPLVRGQERSRHRVLGLRTAGQSAAPAGSFTAVSAGQSHTLRAQERRRHHRLLGRPRLRPHDGAARHLHRGQRRRQPHLRAFRSDATVSCWGDNGAAGADGQATPPTGTFSSVSAGGALSCGLRSNGTIACWGYDQGTPAGRDVRRRQRRRRAHVRARGRRQRHLLGLRLPRADRLRRPGPLAPSARATSTRARSRSTARSRASAWTLGSRRRDLHRRQRRLHPHLRRQERRRCRLLGLQRRRPGRSASGRGHAAGRGSWGLSRSRSSHSRRAR